VNKKQVFIFFVILIALGIAFLIYDGVKKSQFTERDLSTEKVKYISAKATSDEIRRIITTIPSANNIIINEDTDYQQECHNSGINIKAGYKSRFCEKKIVAYIGVSKDSLTRVTTFLTNELSSPSLGFDRERAYGISSRDVEKQLRWSGRLANNMQVKFQTKQRNDLKDSRATEMLNQNDYVLDIYYYNKYSEITKPLSLFDYF
jgi:hypothetical protein